MQIKKSISVVLFLLVYYCTTAQNWDINLGKNINPNHPGSGYWQFTSASIYLFSAAVPVGLLAAGFSKNDPLLKKKIAGGFRNNCY